MTLSFFIIAACPNIPIGFRVFSLTIISPGSRFKTITGGSTSFQVTLSFFSYFVVVWTLEQAVKNSRLINTIILILKFFITFLQ